MRPGRIGGLIYGQRSYVPTPDKKHRVAVTADGTAAAIAAAPNTDVRLDAGGLVSGGA